MFLNIITPCSRPENLYKIAESINIPRENYRWLVVFDSNTIPNNIPGNCEAYAIKIKDSIVGNGQRNYALDLIKEGHIYFNDDDTTIHSDLWSNVYNKDNEEFISFIQQFKNNTFRLSGISIKLNNIDSHNFIVHSSIVGSLRWILNRYDADGIFAEQCFNKLTIPAYYIPKVLSIYNSLRE
jgi:hypothetical protein